MGAAILRSTIGHRMHARECGRGEVMLLLAHGFGADHGLWSYMLPCLQSLFRVVTFDFMGFGQSDRHHYRSGRYSSLTAYAEDLRELTRVLRHANPETALVCVGQSIGGGIGLLAAAEDPDLFDAMVLIGSSARYLDDPQQDYSGGFSEQDIEELLAALAVDHRAWMAQTASAIVPEPALAEELVRSFAAYEPAIAWRMARMTFHVDLREVLPRCVAPTLVLQTPADPIVPQSAAQYLVRHLPDAELRLIEATGHCPHLTAPGITAAAIEDFVRRRVVGRT